MSDLSSSIEEDGYRPRQIRKVLKQSRSASDRTLKRPGHMQDCSKGDVERRFRRVMKACDRCRLKKTKCDGDSPCRRCKDDGMVCTAARRKTVEFKQLPEGYAQILENTHYTLIATIHKLYAMIRNNDTWDLGELELNDRGQPVVQDIATRLGCLRPPPDSPIAFPEDLDQLKDPGTLLKPSCSRASIESTVIGNSPPSSTSSSSMSHADGDPNTQRHSTIPEDYDQVSWEQERRRVETKAHAPIFNHSGVTIAAPLSGQHNSIFDGSYTSSSSTFHFNSNLSVPLQSPPHLSPQSPPVVSRPSPFSVSASLSEDGIPAQFNSALDMASQFIEVLQSGNSRLIDHPLEQQQYHQQPSRNVQQRSEFSFEDGTIAPFMLDYNNFYARPNTQLQLQD